MHQEKHTTIVTPSALRPLDMLGIGASSLCLVHCMAMPVLIAAMPMFVPQVLEGPVAHYILGIAVLTFALLAIGPGYARHRQNGVAIFAAIGVVAVLIATFLLGESRYEFPLITAGNLMLIVAHVKNYKLISKACC
jgi:hypothetical protein